MKQINIITPLSIDSGATNTGVHSTLLTIQNNKFVFPKEYSAGTCISIKSNDITFFQKDRTQKRHQLRSSKRKILIKRLLEVILHYYNVDFIQYKYEVTFLRGLCNRRGYTFITEYLEDSIFDNKEINAKLFNMYKENFEERIDKTILLEEYLLHTILEYNIAQLQEVLLAFEKTLHDFEAKGILTKENSKSLQTSILNYINVLVEEKEAGGRHRAKYIQEIEHDVNKVLEGGKVNGKKLQIASLLQQLGMKSPQQLVYLIANINNLQLRILRKYFNDVTMKNNAFWDPCKFTILLWKWIESWHCDYSKDQKNKKYLKEGLLPIKALARNSEQDPKIVSTEIINFLTTVYPERTIPPYEDQNNRNTPKCSTMYLNPIYLDTVFPNWQDAVTNIIKTSEYSKAGINGIELVPDYVPKIKKEFIDTAKQEERNKRQKNAYILQRILDISKATDPFVIRKTCNKKRDNSLDEYMLSDIPKNEKLYRCLGVSLFVEFIDFALQYYQAIKKMRVGLWNDPKHNIELARKELFWKCNTNPPQKNKIAHVLIEQLLGIKQDEQMWNKKTGSAYKFWTDTHETLKGRKSYRIVGELFESVRKSYGNVFAQIFRNELRHASNEEHSLNNKSKQSKNTKNELAKIIKIFKDNPDLYTNFLEGISTKPIHTSKVTKEPLAIIYIFAQIYTILETDIQGFSKSCRRCATENKWRMTQTIIESKQSTSAYGERLSNDSIRPIDGYLGRYMERLANEIASFKIKELQKIIPSTAGVHLYIPILIEENKFTFEEELIKLKFDRTGGKDALSKIAKKREKNESRLHTQKDRIKNESSLCPYCGNAHNGNGDIDHIIPASISKKYYQTVFNSEANLIYVCSTCNRRDKGKDLYMLKDINNAYLTTVFPDIERNDIESYIKEHVSKILDNYINFIMLDQSKQKIVRHALFVEECRYSVISALHTRTKTLVNSTQAFLVKCIRKKLLEYCNATYKEVTVEIHPFLIPAFSNTRTITPVKTRDLLASKYPEFTKPEKQNYLSHIVDAGMTLGASLRDKELFINVLKTSSKYNEYWLMGEESETLGSLLYFDDPDTLKTLVPKQLLITHIKRNAQVFSKSYWSRKVFNDTIYAENYYPLALNEKGELYYGFYDKAKDKACLEKLPTNKKTTSEYKFGLLAPFLLHRNTPIVDGDKTLVSSMEAYTKKLTDKENTYTFFSFDKQEIAFWYKTLFYEKDVHSLEIHEKELIAMFEKFRYITVKKEVIKKYEDYKKQETETLQNYFKVHNTSAIEQCRDAMVDELTQILLNYKEGLIFFEQVLDDNVQASIYDKEIRIQWEAKFKTKRIPSIFYNNKKFNNKTSIKTNILAFEQEIDTFEQKTNKAQIDLFTKHGNIRKLYTSVLQSPSQKFLHKKTKHVLSIKDHTSLPGALFRIERKDNEGNAVFQVLTKNEAFCGTLKDKEVLRPELCKDKSIVPVKKFAKRCPYPAKDTPLYKEIQWFVKEYIKQVASEEVKKRGIKEVYYSEQGKHYYRIVVSVDDFFELYHKTKVEKEADINTHNHYTVPTEFKLLQQKLLVYWGIVPSGMAKENSDKKEVIIKVAVESVQQDIQLTMECRGLNKDIEGFLGT